MTYCTLGHCIIFFFVDSFFLFQVMKLSPKKIKYLKYDLLEGKYIPLASEYPRIQVCSFSILWIVIHKPPQVVYIPLIHPYIIMICVNVVPTHTRNLSIVSLKHSHMKVVQCIYKKKGVYETLSFIIYRQDTYLELHQYTYKIIQHSIVNIALKSILTIYLNQSILITLVSI